MKILFLCVANSARSQMAEALAKKMFSENPKVSVVSAGTAPAFIHPLAVKVLREWGIDAKNQVSKHVREYVDSGVDLVITLCAEEACPVFRGPVEKCFWPLPDPASDPTGIRAFRKVRNELNKRILALGAERDLI